MFFIDKENVDSKKKSYKSDKEKSLAVELQNLRCYRNLRPDVINNVEPHIVKTKTPRDPESKRALRLEKQEKEKTKKVALKKVTRIGPETIVKDKKVKKLEINFNKDIWGADMSTMKPAVNDINEYYLRTTKKLMPQVSALYVGIIRKFVFFYEFFVCLID